MKRTIANNDKNITTLNNLIENGAYKGFVKTENFEMIPNVFPNYLKIKGVLNNNNKYEIKVSLLGYISIAMYLTLLFLTIISLSFIFQGNIILFIILTMVGFILYLIIKINFRKAIERFVNEIVNE